MDDKTRMTRQGIRDLNYYGPKRPAVPPAAVAPQSTEDAAIVPAPLEVPEVVAERPSDT